MGLLYSTGVRNYMCNCQEEHLRGREEGVKGELVWR